MTEEKVIAKSEPVYIAVHKTIKDTRDEMLRLRNKLEHLIEKIEGTPNKASNSKIENDNPSGSPFPSLLDFLSGSSFSNEQEILTDIGELILRIEDQLYR